MQTYRIIKHREIEFPILISKILKCNVCCLSLNYFNCLFSNWELHFCQFVPMYSMSNYNLKLNILIWDDMVYVIYSVICMLLNNYSYKHFD